MSFTVADLIKKLQTFDPEAIILTNQFGGDFSEIVQIQDNGVQECTALIDDRGEIAVCHTSKDADELTEELKDEGYKNITRKKAVEIMSYY
jgi:hypothetical protein